MGEKNKQLLFLFLSSFIILFVGMGLFPLLPLYASEFGASPTTIGYYFAITYIANTAGAMLTGRAVRWLTHRGAFVVASIMGLPSLFLMGQATAFWQAAVLTALAWFSGGINIAVINILTGLNADDDHRGATFTLVFLTLPLGALFGGVILGRLVDWYGFTATFNALTVLWIAVPLIGLLALEDRHVGTSGRTRRAPNISDPPLGNRFALLMGVTLFSSLALQAGRLGAPLAMQALAFSAGEISSATAIGGLVTMPVALLLGMLSDRIGRERFLTLAYLLTGFGAAVLISAAQIWQFYLAVSLMTVSMATSGALTSVLATDALPPEALARALPRINAMNSIAGTISFAGAGYVLEAFGPGSLFIVAALFAGIAAFGVRPLHAACGEIIRVLSRPLFTLDCYGRAVA